MGAGLVHTADLDEFVVECDRRGGISSPEAAEFAADFSLSFSTEVDPSLDGFSSDYAEMQLALYRELAGRNIDQETNELTSLDVGELTDGANPYGSSDVDHIAHHARTILTSIIVSDLPPDASVLDMGCGWGISTEMLGFCGCNVHAVDINPLFVDLVSRRAARRGHHVTCEQSSFDAFESNERFDMVFFYESLHHAVFPWAVIDRFARYVKPNGKFTIAGEPIQREWWPSWGLRLDPESVYCIRKFGWFENGWSEEFISECFRLAGLELTLLAGIGIRHSAIGVAVRPESGVGVPSAHWAVPIPPPAPPAPPPPSGLRELARRTRRLARPDRA